MLIRLIASLIVVALYWLAISTFPFKVDPIFVASIFLVFISGSNISIVPGLLYCISYDYLLGDTFPFITITGIIIFGSALWLSSNYPILRKALIFIMIPVYSQFLWFMMLFTYYAIEGISADGAEYFAPFLIGNSFTAFCLGFIVILLSFGKRRRDFSPELLSHH